MPKRVAHLGRILSASRIATVLDVFCFSRHFGQARCFVALNRSGQLHCRAGARGAAAARDIWEE